MKGVIPLDKEQDLVVFVDDDSNEITMEVLDYFFYEGQEYAVLTEYVEEGAVHSCDCGSEHDEQDAFIMKVVPVGEDQEEFIPVEDDLIDKLIDFVQNELYSDDDEDADGEDDDGEDDQ